MSPADRWIRWTTTGCMGLLALIAATFSHLHMHLLVELHGQPGWVAALTPLSVDGMIVAAWTTLLADSRAGQRTGCARISRVVIPRPYNAMIFSLKPSSRVWPLRTIFGSKLPLGSRGTARPTAPTSVSGVFGVLPLRLFPDRGRPGHPPVPRPRPAAVVIRLGREVLPSLSSAV
jgi:hypothetical protein